MLRLAFFGPHFEEQLESARPEALDGVRVVWVGSNRTRFAAEAVGQRPQVLVVDLSALDAEDPKADLERLRGAVRPELVLVIYSYLRRQDLSGLQDEHTRSIQGPVSISSLRSQMLSLIIREMFREGPAAKASTACPTCGRPLSTDSAGTSPSASA